MKGGAKTGFRHVEPEQYEARLLEFKKVDKNVKMTEVKGDNSNFNFVPEMFEQFNNLHEEIRNNLEAF